MVVRCVESTFIRNRGPNIIHKRVTAQREEFESFKFTIQMQLLLEHFALVFEYVLTDVLTL